MNYCLRKMFPCMWTPFKGSVYKPDKDTPRSKFQAIDKKFFSALIKPRAYNYHLEGVATGKKREGAVFRALPVYRVRTPENPQSPPMSFRGPENEGLNTGQNTSKLKD
ncbi:hypothetical protein ACJMK2_037281 [Sinanodonta woodiana]|uniref:Uncharacterized protein n=1 Tax=Sinanodonta woodiana TaxID=1069815 RepID=A0ABD3WNB7_SINWO